MPTSNTISQQDERAQQLIEVVRHFVDAFSPELMEERLNNLMEGFLESNYVDDGPQLRDHFWTVREIINTQRQFAKILDQKSEAA